MCNSVSALPAGSVSVSQVVASVRGVAASLGFRVSVRVVGGGAFVSVRLASPAHARSFASWLGECVFSAGFVRQCLGFASCAVAGSSVILSEW